ncbi:MAG: stage V sporulation protein AC [Clostridia bacterium]|jgi:stage V sporulation protein AC|nr:stage V sporulation protein AC [Clostridia bacterium]
MEKEEIIRQKYEARQQLLKTWPGMNEDAKNNIYKEIQTDHQKLIVLEPQAEQGRRQTLLKLRADLEKQQKDLQDIDALLYRQMTTPLAPKPNFLKNLILAFVVGGLICTVGQLIMNLFMANGVVEKDAGTATSTLLIFAGAFFTGLGVYDELGKRAGAGSIVPITGFANSVAAAALEFKREGFIYGVGARIFTVAGPVIVYGTLISILIGLVHYF